MSLTFIGYSEVNNPQNGKKKGSRDSKGGSGPRPHRKGTAAEARAMFGQYSRGATPAQ